jgi:glutathione S-transferase
MAEKPTLAYWDLRGIANPIRMLLHYADIPFEDKRHDASWFQIKPTIGLDFPNLPYWIEGDLKLVQSIAILRHVARKANLVGKDEAEQSRLEMLEQQANDLRTAIAKLVYNEKYEELRADFVKSIPDLLKPWSDYLGSKQFLAGGSVTYVDFLVADILNIYSLFEPTSLATFPNLSAYVQRVEDLPRVAEFLKSGKYQRRPVFGPLAKVLNMPMP